ncbi:MAG: DUF1289 domain-containing protein [Sulfurovum sp.]|nr:DUF1289 domain-containing protein [Sulfurovum sp.]
MGCYRTLDNMRAWHSSSDKEKIEMLRLAKERKTTYNAKKSCG